ncbi:MAG TPA: MerR family DNA-binding transcriptional regulator [Rhizomicrobium sp.]|nr:MerR family DNA-binding transcriptional regulator [Rhizomicrobium sp.]
MSRTYTIRDLTREFGVTARTLRFYEIEGLLAPRRQGQARIYSNRDRARLSLILRGRRVGFSLAEIAEILDLYERGDGGLAQLQHAQVKFAERIDALERQRIDIDVQINDLKTSLTMIQNKLEEREPTRAEPVRMIGYGVLPAEREDA